VSSVFTVSKDRAEGLFGFLVTSLYDVKNP
jgi:hypothetical protein